MLYKSKPSCCCPPEPEPPECPDYPECPEYPEHPDDCCDKKHHLCHKLAKILEGKIELDEKGLCVITRKRHLRVEIACKPAKGPLLLNNEFSFQKLEKCEDTLNLGKVVLLQGEVNPFIRFVSRHGIEITAVHNDWLFERPRLIYVHIFSIDNPFRFAEIVAKALEELEEE